MANMLKHCSVEFKAKVAIEAIKQHKMPSELTTEYAVHATQIHNWKKQALEAIPIAFATHKQTAGQGQQALINELYRQLGQVVAKRD